MRLNALFKKVYGYFLSFRQRKSPVLGVWLYLSFIQHTCTLKGRFNHKWKSWLHFWQHSYFEERWGPNKIGPYWLSLYGKKTTLKTGTHQTDVDGGVGSRRLRLGIKVALDHTAKTTADDQLAYMFCACVKNNNCLQQQMTVVYIHHSKKRMWTRNVNIQIIHKAALAYHFGYKSCWSVCLHLY